jgi:hypothetical protein
MQNMHNIKNMHDMKYLLISSANTVEIGKIVVCKTYIFINMQNMQYAYFAYLSSQFFKLFFGFHCQASVMLQ